MAPTATSAPLAEGAERTTRRVRRDVRLRDADPPKWDGREYRPMEPRSEFEHVIKHVLSAKESWADLTGKVSGFDDIWHAYVVALKEHRRDRRVVEFQGRHRTLPALTLARHVLLSELSQKWPLAIAALMQWPDIVAVVSSRSDALRRARLHAFGTKGKATEESGDELNALGAALRERHLSEHLAPFLEEFRTAASAVITCPEFVRDLRQLRDGLSSGDSRPVAEATLLALLAVDADERVGKEMTRFARSVCKDPDGLVASYRKEIDESIEMAAQTPRHCEYRYKQNVAAEAYLGRSGVIVCLQRKGGEYRVTTCYRSYQGIRDRERQLETALAFCRNRNVAVTALHTAEAWGEAG
jgi:hypothetical protein